MATILIVEDNPRHLRITSDFLQSKGYKTIGVANIKDALEQIAKFKARKEGSLVVVIDIAIPEEDGGPVNEQGGIELSAALLKKYSTTIPAIFNSVFGERSDMRLKAQEHGRAIVSKTEGGMKGLLSEIDKIVNGN